MVKPDGVERRLVGESIARFERRGLTVLATKTVFPNEKKVRDHYVEHEGQEDFYDLICHALMQGPMVAVILEGIEAVRSARQVIGSPVEAQMGTIRGDFAYAEPYNIIHGANSESAAIREMKIWFGEDDPLVQRIEAEYKNRRNSKNKEKAPTLINDSALLMKELSDYFDATQLVKANGK